MFSNHRSYPHGIALTFLYKRNISLEKTARSFNLWHTQTFYVIFLLKQTKRIACNSLALLRIAGYIRLLWIWEKNFGAFRECENKVLQRKELNFSYSMQLRNKLHFLIQKLNWSNLMEKNPRMSNISEPISSSQKTIGRESKLFWRRSEWARSSSISYLKYFSCVSYLDSDIRSFKCWIQTFWRRFCKINIDIFTIFGIWLSQECRIPFRTPISNS